MRAACWLAGCCGGGGIWLTLTGSFGEGEGRGLVESKLGGVEWRGDLPHALVSPSPLWELPRLGPAKEHRGPG